jgi:uncharacterized protein
MIKLNMNKDKINIWKKKFEDYLEQNPLDDASHDITHFKRVWKLAEKLASKEDDKLVIIAACYFHDIVNYPKNHPNRSLSSRDAAIRAQDILRGMDFPIEKLDNIHHCIEAHSYSANIQTRTREAEIVQDADRMESLGAIGLARTFYVAGRMGSHLFCGDDPFAENRELDDSKYAVDHFKRKLLKLPSTMKTVEGKKEALKRAKVLEIFLENLKEEL